MRTWQRIIWELEQRGEAAPLKDILGAVGYRPHGHAGYNVSALYTATLNDCRLYEERRPNPLGGTILYLGLNEDVVDPSWLWAGRDDRSAWQRMMRDDPYEDDDDGA